MHFKLENNLQCWKPLYQALEKTMSALSQCRHYSIASETKIQTSTGRQHILSRWRSQHRKKSLVLPLKGHVHLCFSTGETDKQKVSQKAAGVKTPKYKGNLKLKKQKHMVRRNKRKVK
jgi:hypothetical protein